MILPTRNEAEADRSRKHRETTHRCGCSLPGDAFLELVDDYARGARDLPWTHPRPLTDRLHWTCGAAAYQRHILSPEAASSDRACLASDVVPPATAHRPLKIVRALSVARGGADIVLRGGRIFTADPGQPWCSAIAVGDGAIMACGDAAEIDPLIGATTVVVELDGRLVIPGFNDAHMHHTPDPAGIRLPIDPVADPDFDAIRPMIERAVGATPPGTWIYGVMGERLINDATLDRRPLDAIAPDHPILLLGLTNHTNVANSAAMRRLGIGDNAPDPLGGFFERLPGSSRPSGRINEYAQWAPQRCFAAMASVDEGASSLRQLADECLRFGVTTIQNMSWTPLDRYAAMLEAAAIPIKVRLIRFPPSGPAGRLISDGRDLPARLSSRSEVSGTKWILDGTTVERAAAMGRPYADAPDRTGRMNFDREEIAAMMREAIRFGDPLLLHAIGSEAVATVLDVAAQFEQDFASGALVLRLEHGDGLTAEQLQGLNRLGITVVQNPSHFLFPEIYGPRFGADRPFALFRSLFEQRCSVGIGSDGPLNPFLGLYAAVVHPARPAEASSLADVLIAYTAGSAAAEGKASTKGRLSPGFAADLAVLSQDIFDIPPDRIPATSSLLTMIDGVIVYEAGRESGQAVFV